MKKAFRYRHEPGVSNCFRGRATAELFSWFSRSTTDSFQEPLYLDLIKLADVKEGYTILDVGCGDSPLLDLKNRSYDVVGLDKSKAMLEMAKEKERAILIRGDAQNLPFRDNYFDAVISKDVLQYVQDREKATEEMARVVKSGKKIAITITPPFKVHKLNKVECTLKKLGFHDVKNDYRGFKIIPTADIKYAYGTKPV